MALSIRRKVGVGEAIRIRSKDGARLIIEICAGRGRGEIVLRCSEPENSTERLEVVRDELDELPWEYYNE